MIKKVYLAVVMMAFSLGCQKANVPAQKNMRPPRFKTGPVTTTLTANPDATFTNSNSIEFNFTSNAVDAIFVCRFNSSEPKACVPPVIFTGLLDGHYEFTVTAVSPTMGKDPVGANHLWTVDTVPPVTKIASTVTGVDQIVFAISANESPCTFTCTFDGKTDVCATPVSLTGVSPGPHVFKAVAMDRAGNTDPIGAEEKFELRPAVTTKIVDIDPSTPYVTRNSIQFTFNSNISNATFLCGLNGGKPVTCASPYTYSGLNDGDYYFKVQAVDSVGDIDPIGDSYRWVTDTTPPTGHITKLDATSTTLTITWTTDEPSTTILTWGLDTNLNQSVLEDQTVLSQTHVVTLKGLSSNTNYSMQPAGADRATNGYRLKAVVVKTKR